jgi:O-antigen ligase
MQIRDKIIIFCNKAIYWEIIFIPFVASFSSAAVNVFIALLLVTFIFKKILDRDFNTIRGPLNISFGILFVVSLVSILNSINITSSIQGIVKIIKYGSLLLILNSEIKDKEHIKKIIGAALFGLLLASLDGIYQLIFGVDFFRHKPYDTVIGLARLKAAFPHTNIFAGYLALFVPISVLLSLYYLKGTKRIISRVISALGLFCLVFTFSRSAVFGVWLAILLISLIKKDRLLSLILILMVVVAPFVAPKGIRDWSKSTTSIPELILNKERFALYETSFNMIRHHPLIGVGVNTYCLNYQKYKLHNTSGDTADTMWYAHNSYLQMASEIGIIGFLVFLYLLFKLFKGSIRFFVKADDNFLRLSSLGLLMGIFAFLIHGFTETNLYYPKIAVLFWFQLALLAKIIYFKKEGANG